MALNTKVKQKRYAGQTIRVFNGKVIPIKGRAATTRRYRQSEKGRIANRERSKRARQKLKREVFDAYTNGQPHCQCECGCSVSHIHWLSVDHINGGGNKQRLGPISEGGGCHLYAWLKRNHFPKGFRVLCFNCNLSRNRCP